MLGACLQRALCAPLRQGTKRITGTFFLPKKRAVAVNATNLKNKLNEVVITQPDDWHLHVRDSPGLESVVPLSAQHFKRAIIMPNLIPPVTTTDMALAYKSRIMKCVPEGSNFTPLMTLYLTDNTPPSEVWAAKEAGIVAFKLYPAGATTNSDSGVTSIDKILPTLKTMAEAGVLLLVHGEVTDQAIDIFDREKEFIQRILIPLVDQVPDLKIVMEHITTRDAAEFVRDTPDNIAATVTPQHITLNRNALFQGGLRPHHYCLPVLKREEHRLAVLDAVTSGSKKFFLGTDSAPHPKGSKESACGCAGIFSAPVALSIYAEAFDQMGALDHFESFASFNGPDFYGLPRNTGKIILKRDPWTVPGAYTFGDSEVVPLRFNEEVKWKVVV